ncbi:MAG: hypothetical protein KatS3mg090_0343 [Patescibacteria group bacterium]|nr:MAG: hypothetical protein KatS3mg090_0343 [Patescibacteria group bacterium]
MKVSDIAVKFTAYGSETTKIKEILEIWVKEKFNIFLILDKDQKIKGVITLYDILKQVIPFYLKLDNLLVEFIDEDFFSKTELQKVFEKTAKEIMTTTVLTVREEDFIVKPLVIMYNKNLDYLPVVTKDNKFTGKIINKTAVETSLLKLASNGNSS